MWRGLCHPDAYRQYQWPMTIERKSFDHLLLFPNITIIIKYYAINVLTVLTTIQSLNQLNEYENISHVNGWTALNSSYSNLETFNTQQIVLYDIQ